MESQNKLFRLDNSNIIISGGAGLLGEQHARAILMMNGNLVLIDKNFIELKKIKKKLEYEFNKKITIFKCDVAAYKSVKNIYSKLKKKNFLIDVIINNAALNPPPGTKLKSNFQKELAVSLIGAENLIKIFSAQMIKNKKGSIINIGSDLSVIAPDQSLYSHLNYCKPLSYSIIKHGIVGLTKYYASLFGKYNIRCNCLSPGGVFNYQDKVFVKNIKKKIPLNRMATKYDFIGTVQYLCSDASKYLTGQNIIVDGGRTII
tara:strand:+ start:2010 stop:2789 length:780 start_codon:yes stop_codon:yes gene_type:complete